MKLKYTLNGNKNGLVVTGGKNLKGELVIPSEDCLGGKIYPVIAIRDWAFYGCSALTSIVIPNSVTEIGEYAFGDCSALTSIVISDSVTKIGDRIFYKCSALTSIVVDKENRHYDSREGCNAIIESNTNTLIAGCSTTVIPNPVTKIGNEAFRGCTALTSIEIPDSVTGIGDWAFYGCSALTSIEIPDSVTKVGDWAFSCCTGLTSIIVDKENRHYDSREGCNAIIESDTNILVTGCSTTIIPDSVTKIGVGTFDSCSGLTSIVIPDSVTEIGNDAFFACSGLTSIRIPDSVTEIRAHAFERCNGLTSIVINDASLLEDTGVPEGVEIVKP